MNEQFVPYDLALELKELGFDEECFATFSFSNKKLSGLPLEDMEGKPCNALEYTWKNSEIHSTNTAALLWQQAFDFFRKKHNLNGEIVYNILELDGYWWQVNSKEGDTWSSKNETFPYEEAQKQCLIKLIEICKKKE